MASRQVGYFILFGFLVVSCECFSFGCPPCGLVDCPEPACNENLRVLDPECGCCPVCAVEDGQQCGGLTNVQCKPGSTCMYRLGIIIGENRMGICEPAECKRMHCHYRRYCGYRDHYYGPRLLCQCVDFKCDNKYHPVCGYDGVTYSSICDLQLTECLELTYIGHKHYGPCAPTPEPPPTPAPKTHYVQTNAIPSQGHEDDILNQQIDEVNDEFATPPPQGCADEHKSYALNSMNKVNDCTYLYCDYDANLTMIKVPGCPDGPIEPDYGITRHPVHGGWSEWTDLGCVGTCHGATRLLTRTCTNPTPLWEGRNCSGPAQQVLKCIPDHCNYTCEYEEWSDWSPCSVTCGSGTQTRTRGLTNNITKEESNNCYLDESRQCTALQRYCPTTCQRVVTGLEHQVNENNCVTVYKRPIYSCAGPCAYGEECCKRSRRRRMRWVVHCPGDNFWQEARFDVIRECQCTTRRCPRESD